MDYNVILKTSGWYLLLLLVVVVLRSLAIYLIRSYLHERFLTFREWLIILS